MQIQLFLWLSPPHTLGFYLCSLGSWGYPGLKKLKISLTFSCILWYMIYDWTYFILIYFNLVKVFLKFLANNSAFFFFRSTNFNITIILVCIWLYVLIIRENIDWPPKIYCAMCICNLSSNKMQNVWGI
jgi:hypothetical protein